MAARVREQPLYDVELTLRHDDVALDDWRRRVGFRTVLLDTSTDVHGTGFTLVVNGERLFARGVNWIPDDVFPSRITRERYRERLAQAAGAGVDLVRVWGGGIYESEDFYDACDELGLLVWQDFPFACAAYPEEQPLRGEVEAEARENVVRLMPHPSLVLWNGNNENLWGFKDWGWEQRLAGESWGEGYYLGVLPRVVAELDPTRPYSAGSPWSGSWERHPNDPAHGTHHSWEVWNRDDYADYRLEVPRFVAEFGWQAPPAYATLRRALPGERLAADSPACCTTRRPTTGTGSWSAGSPAIFLCRGGLRPVALPHPGQPGPCRGRRDRALALALAGVRRDHRVAAQRLLAGDVLGGDRRGRAREAALPRAAAAVRGPAAHASSAGLRTGVGRRQSVGTAVVGDGGAAADVGGRGCGRVGAGRVRGGAAGGRRGARARGTGAGGGEGVPGRGRGRGLGRRYGRAAGPVLSGAGP